MDRQSRATRTAMILMALAVAMAACGVLVFPTPLSAQAPSFDVRDAAELQTAIDMLDVVDLQGRRWTAADLQGRIVLIDFWATWCAPCLAQIPELKRLRDRHGRRFEVLAISLDARGRRDLIAWLNRQAITWPQVHDGRAFSSPIARGFRVTALPASMLVVDGRIAALNLRGDALEKTVERLVRQTARR
jgi:thiol-disulfide isomerase/thioredoxin